MKYIHTTALVESSVHMVVADQIATELNNHEGAELVTGLIDQTAERASFVYRVPA